MTLLLLAAVIFGQAVELTQSIAVNELSELRLRDQYGDEDSLAAYRGQVVVVMVVTARRLRNIKPWEADLREQMEGVQYLRIADVPEGSPADSDQVAEKLRERVPDEVPVLIDMERRWATTLVLDTDRPNLLLVDARGRLVATFRGRYTPQLAADVIEALKKIQGAS